MLVFDRRAICISFEIFFQNFAYLPGTTWVSPDWLDYAVSASSGLQSTVVVLRFSNEFPLSPERNVGQVLVGFDFRLFFSGVILANITRSMVQVAAKGFRSVCFYMRFAVVLKIFQTYLCGKIWFSVENPLRRKILWKTWGRNFGNRAVAFSGMLCTAVGF